MKRYLATLSKELRVLFRDRAGMAILIVMPAALIFIMVIVQEVPFKDFQEIKIPIAVYDADQDSLGSIISKGISQNPVFEVELFDPSDDLEMIKMKVKDGDYKVAIIIPEGTSKGLRKRIETYISTALYGTAKEQPEAIVNESGTVELYFDPVIKNSFKQTVLNNLEKHLSKIELKTMFELFSSAMIEMMPAMQNVSISEEPMLMLVEKTEDKRQEPGMANFNSVQHNVPAYTIFGMFFIVITLASNIIKERDDGSELRLRLIPGTFWPSRLGRISAYVFVTLLQAILMLAIGVFVMPLIGYPQLTIGSNYFAIFSVIIAVGLAACGYGLLIGTIFKTHQQSAVFGAVSVVIMSALGGVWVPIFVMPDYIQSASNFIPVFWGLDAFNNLFLRDGSFQDVLPSLYRLVIFSFIALLSALAVEKYKYSIS